jgi:hypothetical protein
MWITDQSRSDGIRICQEADSSYSIYHADRALVVAHCPCCGRKMFSPKAAKAVADYLYPENVLPWLGR